MKNKLKLVGLILIALIVAGVCGFLIYLGIKAQNAEVSHPLAKFEIENYGTIDVELYPEYAPNTVSNFIALIKAGYYNNKIIYGKDELCIYMGRVVESDEGNEETTITVDLNENKEVPEEEKNEYKTTMASILDEKIEKDSEEDYEYEINGEFVANGFNQNTLRHEKGIISLNRSDYSIYGLVKEGYNSGKAMFAVMMSDDVENLNGRYCAFGRIVGGMDVLEKIYNECEVKKSEDEEEESGSSTEEFANYPIIKSASVETFNVDYGTPTYHKAYDINSYLTSLYSQYY